MKKISMFAAGVALTALTVVSCDGGSTPSAQNEADSMAYYYGLAQAQSLKQYMGMQLGVDSADIEQFIKGINEGALNEADPKKDAYMKGISVGHDIQQMAKGLAMQVFGDDSTNTIDPKYIVNGLVEGMKGTSKMSSEEAFALFQSKMEPIQEAKLLEKYGDNKTAGEKFLLENAKKEGVVITKSGLQYKVLVAGTGALPTDTTKVKVNYEGRLIDGTVFDSSYERNSPFTVDMAQPRVISGWVEALKLMPAGSKWEIYIPQELGYGKQDMGQIKPFSTLVFTIEVLK